MMRQDKRIRATLTTDGVNLAIGARYAIVGRMDLQPSDEQQLLGQTIDRYLERKLAFAQRREQVGGEDFVEFWRDLDAELGVAAAGLPETADGLGGGSESEMIVAGALGRGLAVTPYVMCHVLSANLLHELGVDRMVSDIVDHKKIVVTAVEETHTRGDIALATTSANKAEDGWHLSGTKLVVDFAAQADVILVPARFQSDDWCIFAIDPVVLGSSLKSFALIDQTPSADILLDRFPVAADALIAFGPHVLPALEKAIDRARAALCAEGAGIASVMVADTVAYTREREQFGVPIASFQALQHRMVDMWAKAQEIEAAALLAALKVDDPAAVSAAFATVSEGLRLIGQEAVQLHGAMGLTEELRVGHFFKRATVLEHRLGDAATHVERYRLMRSAA